ncbi:addiction module toxin RelE [Citrobacter pasteurii]|nr:addiction module toxin RelE [Citrobacter pasteurii]
MLCLYVKSFKMHRGGKRRNPHEHRKLCDWGF